MVAADASAAAEMLGVAAAAAAASAATVPLLDILKPLPADAAGDPVSEIALAAGHAAESSAQLMARSSSSHRAAAAPLEAAAAAAMAAAVLYTKVGGLTAEVGVRMIAVQLSSWSELGYSHHALCCRSGRLLVCE